VDITGSLQHIITLGRIQQTKRPSEHTSRRAAEKISVGAVSPSVQIPTEVTNHPPTTGGQPGIAKGTYTPSGDPCQAPGNGGMDLAEGDRELVFRERRTTAVPWPPDMKLQIKRADSGGPHEAYLREHDCRDGRARDNEHGKPDVDRDASTSGVAGQAQSCGS